MNALTKFAANVISALLAIASAAAVSIYGGNAMGLFRGTQTVNDPGFQMTTYSIIDEGMIAMMASLGGAILASSIAANGAGIGKAAILGILSGALVAAGAISVSKAGFSEGPPIIIGTIVVAVIVGVLLRITLNKSVKQAVRS